jgi:hypothetical protein
MFKHTFKAVAAAILLGLSTTAGAVTLRDLAGCKPGADDPVVTHAGLFNVHLVCDHLLFEIPNAMYGRDMLLNTEFAALAGSSDFIAPGTLVDNRVIRWSRRGNKVNLVFVNFEIAAARTPGMERAVQATSLPSVLKVFDIVGRGEKGEAIIDVTPLFSAPPRAFAVGFMKNFGMSEIDVERSYIEEVKAFPGNVAIRFFQTWVADREELLRRVDAGDDSINGSRGFEFYTNIYLLPEQPMRPRFWDPRVGYFATSFHDYGTGNYGGVPRGFIQRYRLEKKDPQAAVSEPVQPIVFYVGRSVPEVWRPYIKEAVEDWQGVLAQAGFEHAIVARDAPTFEEDPLWDPDDLRYNVIRWTPSGRRNALGAAVVDPRSGEVISSHTLLWHDVLKLLETWYFTQVSPMDARAQKLPLPPELMGELLRYVLRHEIGHALGLRHNFKASAAVSVNELRNPQWTQRWGTSASTMSYARFNYVAQPGDGAALLPRFGPYDYFAIEWGYKTFASGVTLDEEHALLDEIAARQVSDPLLRFGGEDDVADVDPTVFSNVIGGDPIAAGDMGLRNIDRIMAFIVPATTHTGEGYERLSAMYEALVQQRHRELTYVARIVGGVEETRNQAGRGKVPFDPIAPARQAQATKFLLERAFVEPKPLLDTDVLRRITPFDGTTPLQGSNVDLLRRLVDPAVFRRMQEASSMGRGRYTGLELLRDLNNGLFSELDAKVPIVGSYRRQLQRNYVAVLLTATGTINDPSQSANINGANINGANLDSEYTDAGGQRKAISALVPNRSFDSGLAAVGQQFGGGANALTEYRATLRAVVVELYKKIDVALGRAKDADTQLHLKLIKAQLANVS